LLSKPALLLWDTHYQYLTQQQQEVVFKYIDQHCDCTVILSATTDALKDKTTAVYSLSQL
jgi:hypothetical protein